VALHDGSMSSLHEADVRCAQGMELALQRWWQLPELGVQNHIPLLQQFQQLVELQESAKVRSNFMQKILHWVFVL
jgi:transformation/transcription domain-associated protein